MYNIIERKCNYSICYIKYLNNCGNENELNDWTTFDVSVWYSYATNHLSSGRGGSSSSTIVIDGLFYCFVMVNISISLFLLWSNVYFVIVLSLFCFAKQSLPKGNCSTPAITHYMLTLNNLVQETHYHSPIKELLVKYHFVLDNINQYVTQTEHSRCKV